MAVSSTYLSILQAVQTIVEGLDLKDWNGNSLPIAIRKLPKSEEDIDALPQLIVSLPNKPVQRTPLGFGPVYKMVYPVDVVAVAAGNQDFTTHLDTYLGWHAAIVAAFPSPAGLKAIVSIVWDVDVEPDLVIEAELVDDNYDYGGLTIKVVTVED